MVSVSLSRTCSGGDLMKQAWGVHGRSSSVLDDGGHIWELASPGRGGDMAQRFVHENAVQRERLHALVAAITDRQLDTCLPNGWPVYCVLAHLGFWDQRSTVLLRKWAQKGVSSPPIDPQVVNDALLPFFAAIPPRLAADLAISSAGIIDTELEKASDELVSSLAALGDHFRLDRSKHRKLHLDKIQEAIGPWVHGSGPTGGA